MYRISPMFMSMSHIWQVKGWGWPRFFTTHKNRRSLISITGSVTDDNCSEQSQPERSITQIKFKIQCSFRTSFPNYSQDIFSKTTKAGHIMHKKVSHPHAKNYNLLLLWLVSLKPFIFKNDAQMWKLHRKLNFPNIFQFAAIYTWVPAFKN